MLYFMIEMHFFLLAIKLNTRKLNTKKFWEWNEIKKIAKKTRGEETDKYTEVSLIKKVYH